MKLSALVVSFRGELLDQCLHHLKLGLRNYNHELIVVNNNRCNSDAVKNVSLRYNAIFMNSGGNVFFPLAVNWAVETNATGELLLLVHDDAVVDDKFICTMLSAAEKHEAKMVGATVSNKRGNPIPAGRDEYGEYTIGAEKESEIIETFSSSVEFFDMKLFRELDGFDKSLILDYFEADFILRAGNKHRACIVQLPNTIHFGGGPRPRDVNDIMHRDGFIFYSRWPRMLKQSATEKI